MKRKDYTFVTAALLVGVAQLVTAAEIPAQFRGIWVVDVARSTAAIKQTPDGKDMDDGQMATEIAYRKTTRAEITATAVAFWSGGQPDNMLITQVTEDHGQFVLANPDEYETRLTLKLVAKDCLMIANSRHEDSQPIRWRPARGADLGCALASFGLADRLTELLAKDGALLDRPDADGNTPLLAAAASAKLEVVKLLLKRGADSKRRNAKGEGAVFLAAGRACGVDLLQTLLDAGAEAEYLTKQRQTPLLVLALVANDSALPGELAALLIAHGAKPTATDPEGGTPLYFAASRGVSAMAKVLLEKGAAMEAEAYGRTPLAAAAANGQTATVKLLLEKGANPNGSPKHPGQHPLKLAANDEIKALLKAKGATLP